MSFNFFKPLIVVLLATSLSACVKDAPPLTVHEFASPDTTATSQKIENSDQFFNSLKNLSTVELAIKLLDEKTLANQKISLHTSFAQALHQLSQATVKLDDGAEKKQILSLYEKTLFYGCNSQLKACQFSGLFANNPHIGSILVAIADSKTDLEDKYRVLHMALDITPTDSLKPVIEAYKLHSSSYLALLQSQDTPASRASIIKTQRLIETFALPNQQRIVVNGTTYQQQAMKDLTDYQNKLLTGHSTAAKLLDIKPISDIQIAWPVFLLFNKTLTIGEAINIISQNRLDGQKFSDAVVALLRLKFFENLVESHKNLSLAVKGDFNPEVFFETVKQNLTVNETLWNLFIADANRTAQLVNSVNIDKSIKDQILLHFDRVKYNIKISSIFPHMIALGYYIAKFDISRRFKVLFWNFKDNSDDTLRDLLFGKAFPWFNYGAEDETLATPLSRYEMLHAFAIALNSGLFDQMKIDASDVISQILSKAFQVMILNRNTHGADKGMLFYTEILETEYKGTRWQQAQKLCQELKTNQPAQFEFSIQDLKYSPLMGHLKWEVLSQPTLGFSSSISINLLPYFQDLAMQVENVRVGVRPSIQYGTQMIAVLNDHLKARGIDDTKRNELVLNARKPIREIQKTTARFLSAFDHAVFGHLDCMETFVMKDREAIKTVILEMAQWFQTMHAELKTSPQVVQDKINSELTSPHYRSMTKIENGRISFRLFDILLKIRSLILKRQPELRINIPTSWLDQRTFLSNDNYEISINYREDMSEFVSRALIAIFGDGSLASYPTDWFSSGSFVGDGIWIHIFDQISLYHKFRPTHMTLERLLNLSHLMVKEHHITQDEEGILKLLNREFWIGSNARAIEALFIDYNTKGQRGIYDIIFGNLLSDYYVPGSSEGVDMSGDDSVEFKPPAYIVPLLQEATQFAIYRRTVPEPFFNMAKNQLEGYESYYRKELETFSSNIDRAKETIKSLQLSDSIQIRIGQIMPTIRISDGVDFRIQGRFKKFHEVTNNYWLKKP